MRQHLARWGVFLLLVLIVAVLIDRRRRQTPPAPKQAEFTEEPQAPPQDIVIENGLNGDERQVFYHLAQGTEVFPLEWLRALENPKTGKPFLDGTAWFGFLADSRDADKLPVGLAADTVRGWEPLGKMVGLTCAACHVNELIYKNNRVRIDGAPSLLNARLFFAHLAESAEAAVARPAPLLAFLSRLREGGTSGVPPVAPGLLSLWESKASEQDENLLIPLLQELIDKEKQLAPFDFVNALTPAAVDAEEWRRRVLKDFATVVSGPLLERFQKASRGKLDNSSDADETILHALRETYFYARLLRSRAVFLKRLGMAGLTPDADWGPARVDAFGALRTLFLQPDYVPRSPVRYPTLWGTGRLHWFNCDDSTNSRLERDYAHALAGGAVYDSKSFISTLRPSHVHRLERLSQKLTPPAWPEKIFGAINKDSARRGGELFNQHCAECHRTPAKEKTAPDMLYALNVVGTDPARANLLIDKLSAGNLANTSLAQAVGSITSHLREQSMANLPEPERDAFLKESAGEWRGTGKYAARSLAGMWAAAPYLHNGSVPTLADLLLPAAKRPKLFPIGHREFDPVNIGYTKNVDQVMFLVDTEAAGNSNAGHEYGAKLTADQRRDLLEFFKTN